MPSDALRKRLEIQLIYDSSSSAAQQCTADPVAEFGLHDWSIEVLGRDSKEPNGRWSTRNSMTELLAKRVV